MKNEQMKNEKLRTMRLRANEDADANEDGAMHLMKTLTLMKSLR